MCCTIDPTPCGMHDDARIVGKPTDYLKFNLPVHSIARISITAGSLELKNARARSLTRGRFSDETF